MKITLFIPAILIARISQSVPPFVANVSSVSFSACTADSDCDDLFNVPPGISAFWTCVNDTNNANDTTNDGPFCQFTGCDADADCGTDQTCYKMHKCDENDQFYDESLDLYSAICYDNALCETIEAEEKTFDTICYTGENEEVYYSETEASLCGETCVVKSKACGAAGSCIVDVTCCTAEEWNQNGCIDLLFTEYRLYTGLGMLALVILCCCCCCCFRKIRNKEDDLDETEARTNKYNVYV
eukprot:295473_1